MIWPDVYFNFKELEFLVDCLESSIPQLDRQVSQAVPRTQIPKHLYVSDCIILSAPMLDPQYPYYSGLDIVVMRCIQLTQTLLNKGYLLRGGIDVGPVWHGENNIVGPAYQSAYQIEQGTKMPRIELSEKAKVLWQQRNGRQGNRMCIHRAEKFMVNGLHSYYSGSTDPNDLTTIEETFDGYANRVISTIDALTVDGAASPLSKWMWFKSYLDDEKRAN